jgi:hypothetical protein
VAPAPITVRLTLEYTLGRIDGAGTGRHGVVMASSTLRSADTLEATVHYLADSPDGAVGVLDGWIRDDSGRPTAVVVAQGWFGRRRYAIPIENVIDIDDDSRRVILTRGAAPVENKGLLGRLVERARGGTRARSRQGSRGGSSAHEALGRHSKA